MCCTRIKTRCCFRVFKVRWNHYLIAGLTSKEEKMKESNRLLPTIILVIALAILSFAISCKQKVDVEGDKAAIKEMLHQYDVGVNTGDFDLWISLWADDGVQMPPGTPARIGKEQIREGMKPAFDQMNLDVAINNIEDAKVYGDLGLTRCTYTLNMTPKAGGETINAMPNGKALTIYERQSDGSWKIVFDCFNSSMPPKQ
jgi:uncharacterized protein (TIGR02246 family)